MADSWPHVHRLYHEAGFDPSGGHVEIVFAGTLDRIGEPGPPPVPGLSVRRELGTLGVAFNGVLDGEVVGTFEVDADLTHGGTNVAVAGWADECNHSVREDRRGQGIGTWLVKTAAGWLRLGGMTRLLAYAWEDASIDAATHYYGRYGLVPVGRNTRGWQRHPQ